MARATAVKDDNETESDKAPEISPEAQQLIDSGARPTSDTDVQKLIKQMNEMQARINSLSQAAGVPSDPIEAQVQALKAHVQQVANAHPGHDFSELKDVLADLPETEDLTKDITEWVKETVEDHIQRFGGIRHDLDYVRQLAADLHKIFVKKSAKEAAGK